jgi:MFS family permease
MTPQTTGPRAVLALRDFRLFLAVTFLNAVLQQTQSVAVGWDLYERTGSVIALGYVGLAQFLPVILLFLPAGQLADRYDRRMLMVASQALVALGSIGLAFAAQPGVPLIWVYACLFATGVAQVLNRPARDSLQPQIVPAPLFANSVALSSSLFQVASIGGPAVGGVLIAITGSAQSVYLVNMALAVLAMLIAFAIRARRPEGRRPGTSFPELFAGLTHVWRTKLILGALFVDLFAVLFAGANALLPVFAKDILHVGPVGLGWLSAASAVGALTMGLFQGLLGRPSRQAGKTFLWAVAAYGVAMIVFGLSNLFVLSFVALMLAGMMDNMSVVLRHSMVQLYTPDELRGRVSAVNRVFVDSSNQLGALEAGVLATFTSPVFAVVAGGVVTVLVAAAAVKMFPDLRKLERLGG